ncbi:MAG: Mth938-like domain-containing protein [bacterium]
MNNTMKIEHYSFGSMTVNGRIYEKDLIVFPDQVHADWWRKQGHSLALEDLKEVIAYGPELLVIGTGASGVMDVPDSTIEGLRKHGIEAIHANTHDAVDLFNEKSGSKRVVGAFHLTC